MVFFLTLLVSLAALLDFGLGKAGRRRLQNTVVNWWVAIAETPYFGVAKREIEWFARMVTAFYGKPTRIRFYVVASLVSIFVTFLGFGVARLLWSREGDTIGEMVHTVMRFGLISLEGALNGESSYESVYVASYTMAYVANLVGDLLGTIAAVYMLGRLTTATTTVELIRLLCLDLVLAFVSMCIVIWIAVGSLLGGFEVATPFVIINDAFSDPSRSALYILIISAPSLVPSVIHISLILAVLLTKYATPVVRPAVLLVLERLAEAEKGVILTLGAAIAALTKLGQVAVQTFGG